jgi:hypothetical protein
VRIFPLLHGRPAVVGGVQELGGQFLGHALFRPLARVVDEPAEPQRRAPRGADLGGRRIIKKKTRRERTSIMGRTFSNACSKSFTGDSLVFSVMI